MRGLSSGPGWPAVRRGRARRSLGEELRATGRFVLWALIVVLLMRGVASVILGEAGPTVVAPKRVAASAWPDEQARAFAAGFARAFLSYSPRYPRRYVRGLGRFMAPELVGKAVPRFPRRSADQAVTQAVVARVSRVDDDHALIVVAVGMAGSPGARYLAVPVGRDARGGLAVYDLPSFVASPAAGSLPAPESEPLAAAERGEVEDVLVRFFGAFLAGDTAELEYLVPAGERVRALSPALALVGVDSLAGLPSAGRGRRVVLVELRARDPRSGVVYALRYRVALMRADRWYVASVNESPKEG